MSRTPFPWLLIALSLTLLSAPGPLFAQDPDSAGSPETDDEDPSRETDISEDNYRRFMELEDRRLERPAFPVAAIQPTSGLQKMGQLPESSQKHLRNQLRGIILSRGAWTPEERDENYAFVPSAEARGDAQLLRQEAEAWSELVNEYHDREAATLAGATAQPAGEGDGTPADPGAQGQAPSGQPPGGQAQQQANAGTGTGGNPGTDGQQGEEGEAGQEGQDGAQGESGSEGGPDSKSGSESSSSTPPPERPEVPEWAAEDETDRTPTAPSNEGVEQSASEYLKSRGLDDATPGELEAAQGRRTTASAETAARWGEEAQTLLNDPGTTEGTAQQGTPLPPSRERSQSAAENSLTREQLRAVRGVTEEAAPPEDAFQQLNLGVTLAPDGTVQEDPTPEAEEDHGEVPDTDDGGRP